MQKDKERALHHQLRRELELWQYYSIISHQLNSYTPPLTGKSNQPSAELIPYVPHR
jgi:hypothetical protein